MVSQKFRVGVPGLQDSVIGHIQALHELSATLIEVKLSKHLEDLDGLIIPGGESTTVYKLTRAFDAFKVLETSVRSRRAVYGSYVGMIMLADHTLDGIEGQETLGSLDMIV